MPFIRDWRSQFMELDKETEETIADCPCDKFHITERTIRGGRVQFIKQCLTCGRVVGSAIPKNVAVFSCGGDPKPFDKELSERYNKLTHGQYKKQRENKKEDFLRIYDEYLKSDQWRKKRIKVILRANNTCEGCLIESCDVVHHKTYKHVGDEFLFELIGLCNGCHKRLHGLV